MTKSTGLFLRTIGAMTFGEMHEGEQKTVKTVHALRDASIVSGSVAPCGAFVVARDNDGASFGASTNLDENAAVTAISKAREAGVTSNVTLVVSVQTNTVPNPLSDEVLKALAVFGRATVLLVGDDKSVVIATLTDE